MNTIEIIHNPFIVETQFLISGQPPAEGCKLSSYKESRLQVWIEKLFDELSQLFNGDNRFDVTFTGVESDYLDVAEAAKVATGSGMQVALRWIESVPTETRLEKIRDLMNEARQHPQFEHFITGNDDVRKYFEEAFNRDFDVYVVATMSSGKSTLINAMLGRDLLPAANEATTATIAKITDNTSMGSKFSAKRILKNEQVSDSSDDATLDMIKVWNNQTDTVRIDLEGNILAIQERESVRLVLTDTPGPNNSQDQGHEQTTMGFIQDSKRNPLILYVLNAGQLRTNDDKRLLRLVADAMSKGGKQSKDRFIFVINKVDDYDPETEDLPGMMNRVSDYLVENGIPSPQVYPISAELTRLIRKPQDLHTSKERSRFKGMADFFSESPCMDLLQYMPITSRVKRALDAKNITPLLKSSGLPAVEAMIDEYIDKYNFPHRLKRAYDAMSKAIEVGLNEAGLIEQMDQDERLLGHLNEEIQALEYRQAKGFDTLAYKERIADDGKILPADVEQELVTLERIPDNLVQRVASRLSGTVEVRAGETRIKEAETDLQFLYKQLINAYEALFNTSQESIRQDLYKEYQRYVVELFEDSQHLQLPILEGIRKTVGDISFNLSMTNDDITKRRVVIGTRKESNSTWYNPFSWFDTKTVNVYRHEDAVNLGDFWNDRSVAVGLEFSHLVDNARLEIEKGKDTLINQFVAFMSSEFDGKFKQLMSSLKEKTVNRDARLLAVEEAKVLQAWINDFKSKLDKTLAV
ncbi:50S ribosome-binding GTPase [Pseudomonas sp. S35]|uniref:dynamin family protein n=1 Tax=Pseudomonas sp. S35 TaxID=1573719 RepID=UPI00132F043C|nr:dynamin family protein [Pseudomonas sp. S35]QHF43728.1 50S ribosome-binding GTPase [Pseudomonas sp. S35]